MGQRARGDRLTRLGRAPLLWGCALLLVVLHFGLLRRWLAVESRPPAWDSAVHLGTALDYREAFAALDWSGLLLAKPRPGHPPYPPLYHLSLIPILGSDQPHVAAAGVNVVYLLILVFSCAWIAFQSGGALAAAAAMAALGSSAALLEIYREPFPDLAMAAWVAFCYGTILRSRRFEDRRWALAAGLGAALALLSKWNAFVYLLPGAAAGLSDRRRRANLSRALGAAALLCAPWYAANVFSAVPRIWNSMNLGKGEGDPSLATLANWTYYSRFTAAVFGTASALLMAAGAALALHKTRRGSGGWSSSSVLLSGWFAFSYLAWSLVSNKDHRYFLPAVAALPPAGLAALPAPLLALSLPLAAAQLPRLPRPQREDWPLLDILETVDRRAGGSATLCALSNHARMNPTSLLWLARHRGLDRIALGGRQTEIPEWSDFVLLKTGDPGPFLSDETRAILARADDPGSLFRRVFREARRWPLPDGSEAVLFEVRPDLPLLASGRAFRELTVKSALLEGVRVGPMGPGRYEVSARSVRLRKLDAPFRDLRLRLEDARVLEDRGRIYILGARTVSLLSARVSWRDLSQALSRRARIPVSVERVPGGLRASLGGSIVSVEAGVEAAPERLRARIVSVRVLGLRLPFLSGLERGYSLAPKPPHQPFALRLGRLSFEADGLTVAPGTGAGETHR